jgi:transposase
MNTKDFRSIPSSAPKNVRLKAMNAALGGTGRCAAANLFGVTRQAIHKWMMRYKSGEEKANVSMYAEVRKNSPGSLKTSPKNHR